MQETWVRSLGWEDPLEKGKASHSRILAWRIHGLQSIGLQRVEHNLHLFCWSAVDLQCCMNFFCRAKWFIYTHIYILFKIIVSWWFVYFEPSLNLTWWRCVFILICYSIKSATISLGLWFSFLIVFLSDFRVGLMLISQINLEVLPSLQSFESLRRVGIILL